MKHPSEHIQIQLHRTPTLDRKATNINEPSAQTLGCASERIRSLYTLQLRYSFSGMSGDGGRMSMTLLIRSLEGKKCEVVIPVWN